MSTLVLLVLACFPQNPPPTDLHNKYAVVVNPNNQTAEVAGPRLRRIFRAEVQTWPTGETVELLLPRSQTPTKEFLLDSVYGMTDLQLKKYWLDLVYQNRIVTPPRAFPSTQIASLMLGRMRGSIALLPASELDSQAALKVLAIDGKRPDDDGYPLLSKPKTLTGANPQSSGTSAESPTAEASFHRQLAAQPDEPGAIERPATMEDWDGDGWPPIHMLVFAHGRAEGESSKAAGSTRDTNSFGIEVVDVLLTSALTDRMSILAETTYAAQDSGEFVVEVERLLLKYCFNDALNVKAGRFLTSIGYWNRHYHHGEWLQTSIDRPEVIDFEDESGLLPIHSVGVGLNGSFFTGAGVLEYTLEVANGRGPTADVTQSKQDGNREKAINVAVGMKPEFLPGVEFGAGSYFDRIPENTDASAGALHGQVQEQITNLYCAYNDTNWELMGEYFFLEHDYGDRTTHSKGWYAQVGRHLGDWTPYVRVDGIDRAALDDYFESTDAGLTTAIGIRRDINSHAALTLQYERAQVDAQPGGQDIVNQSYVLQLSVVF